MATKKRGKRDYKAEYARRLKRALDKGYSRSVARGHVKRGEVGIRRAKRLGVAAGAFIDKQGRVGYRPTGRERISRIRELGLPVFKDISYGDSSRRVPGPKEFDEERNDFTDRYIEVGLKDVEAYTLWFSP